MKCPYSYPLKSREDIANYLCDHDRYFSRWEHWPISFNVKVHWSPDFDDIKEHLAEHVPDDVDQIEAAKTAWYKLAEELFNEHREHLWDDAVQGMRDLLENAESFYMLWSDEGPTVAEFEYAGRCGGHLCVTGWNGYNLKDVHPDDLRDDMLATGEDEVWPYRDLLRFYKFVRQWEQDFSEKNREAELEYQMAWYLAVYHVEPEWEERYGKGYAEGHAHFGDGNPDQKNLPLADAVQ